MCHRALSHINARLKLVNCNHLAQQELDGNVNHRLDDPEQDGKYAVRVPAERAEHGAEEKGEEDSSVPLPNHAKCEEHERLGSEEPKEEPSEDQGHERP
eukprot:CAMPEP_0185201214 /NCGR_PEP_ID=MMETSP1140-20130426/48803_1 /TAXON_ID=298111 /ORGANISM="Pavlova sp., Strain CCMP459" /LENGTH=98 /DNA_ID=CAMNT_0027768595 /DNA_START=29 /DNA_END=322 /DNA_ORIENTATION=-